MKRPIRMIAAVLALALFAWTLVWMLAANRITKRFDEWRAAQAEAGVAIGYSAFEVKGWPFGWRAIVESPSAQGSGAAQWAWSGERLVASVDPRDLSRVALRLPGEQKARFGAGDLATDLALRAADPQGFLVFDDRGRVDRLDLEFEAAELHTNFTAEPLAARRIALTLAPHRPADVTHETDTLDLSLRANAVRLPAPAPALAALGRDIAAVELDARVQGKITGGRLADALAAWRDDGGTLDVRRIAVSWGPLYLAGDGTLALDEQNRPMGAASARIAGYGETIDALAQAGAIEPTAGALAKMGMNFLGRIDPLAGNRRTVTVPISAQDGIVSVERFKLFRVPPLKLD
jgi:hypothetical protein